MTEISDAVRSQATDVFHQLDIVDLQNSALKKNRNITARSGDVGVVFEAKDGLLQSAQWTTKGMSDVLRVIKYSLARGYSVPEELEWADTVNHFVVRLRLKSPSVVMKSSPLNEK